MRHLELWLDKYQQRSTEIEKELEQYGYWVSGLKKTLKNIKIVKPVTEIEIDKKAAFIDGGEGLYELLGFGVYFIRSSALISEKERFSFIRDLDLNLIEHSDNMKEQVEVKREIMELDAAIKSAHEGVEIIVLDGSLFVKSNINLVANPYATEYAHKIQELFETCKKQGIHLVGVSEDSTSRLLTRKLSLELDIKMPASLTDSGLLRMLTGDSIYQSDIFYPRSKSLMNPKKSASYPTVYLQPTRISNPLRIDFPEWEENPEELISWIYGMSKSSKSYGFPLPLYLAHVDSHIKAKHVEWTARQIIRQALKSSPELGDALLRDTRRNNRPED